MFNARSDNTMTKKEREQILTAYRRTPETMERLVNSLYTIQQKELTGRETEFINCVRADPQRAARILQEIISKRNAHKTIT